MKSWINRFYCLLLKSVKFIFINSKLPYDTIQAKNTCSNTI